MRLSRYRTSAPRCGTYPKSVDISYQTFFSLQVINAARILSSRPKSKVAQENMEVCVGLETCPLIYSCHDFVSVPGVPDKLAGPGTDPDRRRGRHRHCRGLPLCQREPHSRGCQQVCVRHSLFAQSGAQGVNMSICVSVRHKLVSLRSLTALLAYFVEQTEP